MVVERVSRSQEMAVFRGNRRVSEHDFPNKRLKIDEDVRKVVSEYSKKFKRLFMNQFKFHDCTIIATESTTGPGLEGLINKIRESSPRSIGEKLLIISGSHGGVETYNMTEYRGDDGLKDIRYLDSEIKYFNEERRFISRETRGFYERWPLKYLKTTLDPSDVDPRIYSDIENTKVKGISDESPPNWRTCRKEVEGRSFEVQV